MTGAPLMLLAGMPSGIAPAPAACRSIANTAGTRRASRCASFGSVCRLSLPSRWIGTPG